MFASLALYVPHPVFLTLPLSQHKHSLLFRHNCLTASSLLHPPALPVHCEMPSCGPHHGDMFTAKDPVCEHELVTRNQERQTRNPEMSRTECIHGGYIYSSSKTIFLQCVTMTHQHQVPSWHFDKILLPKLGTTIHLNQQW